MTLYVTGLMKKITSRLTISRCTCATNINYYQSKLYSNTVSYVNKHKQSKMKLDTHLHWVHTTVHSSDHTVLSLTTRFFIGQLLSSYLNYIYSLLELLFMAKPLFCRGKINKLLKNWVWKCSSYITFNSIGGCSMKDY